MINTSKLVPAQTNLEFCFVDVYLKDNVNVKLGNFIIIAIIFHIFPDFTLHQQWSY